MANNSMTPEQDLITREFFQKVANDASLFPEDPVGQRNMNQVIMRLLGYVYVNGCYVSPDKVKTRAIGAAPDVTCEWTEDTLRAQEALSDEEDNGTSTGEADSSEPTTDTEVRETVLREDV